MDFYIKHIGDPNYQTNIVQNNGEIEQLLTQIENTLFTRKRDVLGEPDFGCNLEDLVYSFGQNEFQIKNDEGKTVTSRDGKNSYLIVI